MNWGVRLISVLGIFFLALLPATRAFAIDGGVDAKDGEYPTTFGFKSSIRDSSGNPVGGGMEDICSGVLVNAKLILTAAHCLRGADSIFNLGNGTDITSGKKRGLSPSYDHFNANPDWESMTPDMSNAEKENSVANDIGYIRLKKDVDGITPASVYASVDENAIHGLLHLDANPMGYGASVWADVLRWLEADAENKPTLKTGLKKIGKMSVTSVNPVGYLKLENQPQGCLPGDSGGPIFAVVNGTESLIALNESMSVGTRTKLKKKKDGSIVPDGDEKYYAATNGTLLTKKNICWIQRDSGVTFTNVDCSK